jgi:hypothetical protein
MNVTNIRLSRQSDATVSLRVSLNLYVSILQCMTDVKEG